MELVQEVIQSGRLAIGPMTERFERLIASRAGCDHGVAVSSGTAGLHLLMHAMEIGIGDEVITTDQEHTGGVGSWRLRAARDGIVVRELPLDAALDGMSGTSVLASDPVAIRIEAV